MTAIQQIFNNREIAIGTWVIIALVVVLISKSLGYEMGKRITQFFIF